MRGERRLLFKKNTRKPMGAEKKAFVKKKPTRISLEKNKKSKKSFTRTYERKMEYFVFFSICK